MKTMMNIFKFEEFSHTFSKKKHSRNISNEQKPKNPLPQSRNLGHASSNGM
jgi:hypothetical protein